MVKNQEFDLEIKDMTEEGAGIGKTFDACLCASGNSSGFAWFVKDAVIGDRIRAAATKVKKNYGFARLVKVLEPSKNRVEPACSIAKACGGCQLQQISYEAQLAFKENKVRSVLSRIGGFSSFRQEGRFQLTENSKEGTSLLTAGTGAMFEPIIGMQDPWHYRNKAQYPVSRNRDGEIIAGFYAGHTHCVIPCGNCMIGSEADRGILDAVTGWMKQYGIAPYDETTGKGLLRHILIRVSRTTGEVMVCLVINGEKLPKEKELVEALLACRFVPVEPPCRLASVSYSINTQNTNVILGEKVITVYGSSYITDSIGGISFHISPQSFFQVNPVQVERLYGKALEYAGLSGKETVWDLYCGVGTISLFLARQAKKVYGVEIVPKAIEDARENAERNGFANAEFFTGKAEEVVPEWMKGENAPEDTAESGSGDIRHPDVICVDPPRKGCDEKCLETILQAAPKRIVYVSCDPATLARDLKYLCAGGYELKKVCPVDMFPQTVHVETVCLLSKLSGAKNTIDVKVDMDELDVTLAEAKATYEEIKAYVLEQTGLQVSNLYIAQVKRECGIIERENYNKSKSENSR